MAEERTKTVESEVRTETPYLVEEYDRLKEEQPNHLNFDRYVERVQTHMSEIDGVIAGLRSDATEIFNVVQRIEKMPVTQQTIDQNDPQFLRADGYQKITTIFLKSMAYYDWLIRYLTMLTDKLSNIIENTKGADVEKIRFETMQKLQKESTEQLVGAFKESNKQITDAFTNILGMKQLKETKETIGDLEKMKAELEALKQGKQPPEEPKPPEAEKPEATEPQPEEPEQEPSKEVAKLEKEDGQKKVHVKKLIVEDGIEDKDQLVDGVGKAGFDKRGIHWLVNMLEKDGEIPEGTYAKIYKK